MVNIVCANYGIDSNVNSVLELVTSQYDGGPKDFLITYDTYSQSPAINGTPVNDPKVGVVKTLYIVWQNADGTYDGSMTYDASNIAAYVP